MFQCAWNERNDLVGALVGTVAYSSVTETIVRTPPFSYPFSGHDLSIHNVNGDQTNVFPKRLICTSVSSIKGTHWITDNDGGDFASPAIPGWGGYTLAVLTAEFTTPSYLIQSAPEPPAFNDLSNKTYTVSKLKVSPEVLAPPSGSFTFTQGAFANSPLLDIGASQIRTRLELSITRVRMPIIPIETVSKLLGSINFQQFQVGDNFFPEGTALFNGMNVEPRSDPYNGGLIWDIEYQFLINGPSSSAQDPNPPLSWNYFLDNAGKWNPVTQVDGVTPVFRTDDFTPLFLDHIN